jgi:hypothetical protein
MSAPISGLSMSAGDSSRMLRTMLPLPFSSFFGSDSFAPGG